MTDTMPAIDGRSNWNPDLSTAPADTPLRVKLSNGHGLEVEVIIIKEELNTAIIAPV